MDAALLSIRQGIADLRGHLEGMEKHNKLLSIDHAEVNRPHVDPAVSGFYDFFLASATRKAVIDYSAVIILLYGLVERFVEECVKDYVLYLNEAVPSFKELPPKIRDTHEEMSAQLLLNLKLPKYNTLTTPHTIISNLKSCFRTGKGYRLNAVAYIDHAANFKIGTINEFCAKVGLSGISAVVKKTRVFRDYLGITKPEINVDQDTDDVIFEPLTDIATRRNDIAHGMPSELLSVSILRGLIDFVDVFAAGLHSVVVEDALKYDVKHRAIALERALNVIDHRILCVSLINQTVAIGDVLIAVTRRTPVEHRRGRILSLQIDGRPFNLIRRQPTANVGIGVDCRIKATYDFFLLRTPKSRRRT